MQSTHNTTRLERFAKALSGMCVILLRANVRACRLLWCRRGPTGTSVRLLSSNQRCLSCCRPSKLSSGTDVMWLASNRLHRSGCGQSVNEFYLYTTRVCVHIGSNSVSYQAGATTSVSTQSEHSPGKETQNISMISLHWPLFSHSPGGSLKTGPTKGPLQWVNEKRGPHLSAPREGS